MEKIKQEKSLLQAIEEKDQKTIDELEERSKKGEPIWII
jgi:hypothetical protein